MEYYEVYTGTFDNEHQLRVAWMKFYFGPIITFNFK